MNRTTALLAVLVLLLGCSKPEREVEYKSRARAAADISLRLDKNNSFQLDFASMDFMRPDSKTTHQFVFSGKWNQQGPYYQLTFDKEGDTPPDLGSLFNTHHTDGRVEVLSDVAVRFSTKADTLYIWGLKCPKAK